MKHRPWQALFERLPPKTQAEVNKNTAKVPAELDLAEQEPRGEHRRGEGPAPISPVLATAIPRRTPGCQGRAKT